MGGAASNVGGVTLSRQLLQSGARIEQHLRLLTRQFNVLFPIAVNQHTDHFVGILRNQTPHKPANTQPQVVIGLPLFMPRLDQFLLMIDVAQNAQVIVKAGQYREQPAGLHMSPFHQVLCASRSPLLSAPFPRRRDVVRHRRVAHRHFFPLMQPMHGIGVSLDVVGCRGCHDLLA